MEAVILAGGSGTRLRDVVKDIPKPMALVNGRPFLQYLLSWISSFSHIERIILAVGYRSASISEYFGDRYHEISLVYAEESKPLGTGGAIKFAIQKCSGESILIINGDTFFPVDLNSFSAFHTKSKNSISLALKPMKDFSRYGAVVCKDDTITGFREKKLCDEGLINGGIYLINKAFFKSLNLPEVFSFESEVLEKLAGSSLLKCMIFGVPFIDIGTPEDYFKAGEILKNYGL